MIIGPGWPLPNFLILGAQKSGTTWLAYVLRCHPGVFVPREKELHYFTRHFERGAQWYLSHFAKARGAVSIGEATPNYLAANYPEYRQTPRRIRAMLPEARFVVILREPVSRALSAYMHHVMRGRFSQPGSVESHFEEMLVSPVSKAGVLEFGLYAAQLDAYFELFDRRQFLILSYERDLCGNPARMAARVLQFIGAPEGMPGTEWSGRPNAGAKSRLAVKVGATLSGVLRHEETRVRWGSVIQRGCRFLERVVHAPPLALPTETKSRIDAFYRQDRIRLRQLLGADAPPWARDDETGLPTAHVSEQTADGLVQPAGDRNATEPSRRPAPVSCPKTR